MTEDFLSSDNHKLTVGDYVRILERPFKGIDPSLYSRPKQRGTIARLYPTSSGRLAVDVRTNYGLITTEPQFIRLKTSYKPKAILETEALEKRETASRGPVLCVRCDAERPKQRGRKPKVYTCPKCQ